MDQFFLRRVILAVLLTAILTGSCARVEEPIEKIDIALRLLNQKNYDHAIALLTELFQEDRENERVTILLASAYAGSVGVNTIDAFDALKEKLFNKPLGGGKSTSRSGFIGSAYSTLADEDLRLTDIADFERELESFFAQAHDIMLIAKQLPYLAGQERQTLKYSLSILGTIEPKNQRYHVAQVYTAVLAFIQFYNYFRDAMPHMPITTGRNWQSKAFCKIDLLLFFDRLAESAEYLEDMFIALSRSRRTSDDPAYTTLQGTHLQLAKINASYRYHNANMELLDLFHKFAKFEVCE